MNIVRLLRRAMRRVISRKHKPHPRPSGPICDDVEDRLRIMSDQEFAEYLRLHSRSHWRKTSL